MENLLLPTKIEFIPGQNPFSGSLVVTPCFHGYGTTLGNTLRRVLLSSLPGAAVEAFKIKGAQHEFTAVEGVKEDVVQMILNLKQLAVKVYSDEPVVLQLRKKGPGAVTAADIEKNPQVEIINQDMIIVNLTSTKPFDMEIIVGRGRGQKTVEEKNKLQYDLGTIAIDSVYSPIKDVGYSVEYTRVGDITNFEKLTLNIETNGTITPREAVQRAAQIVMDHFTIILEGSSDVIGETPVVERVPDAITAPKEETGRESESEEDETVEKTPKKEAKAKKTTKKKTAT